MKKLGGYTSPYEGQVIMGEYEANPVLSEKDLWLYRNALRVDTLSMALAIVRGCSSLDKAISSLTMERDSRLLSSWPGGITKEEK